VLSAQNALSAHTNDFPAFRQDETDRILALSGEVDRVAWPNLFGHVLNFSYAINLRARSLYRLQPVLIVGRSSVPRSRFGFSKTFSHGERVAERSEVE
jgi:hypothetical protein